MVSFNAVCKKSDENHNFTVGQEYKLNHDDFNITGLDDYEDLYVECIDSALEYFEIKDLQPTGLKHYNLNERLEIFNKLKEIEFNLHKIRNTVSNSIPLYKETITQANNSIKNIRDILVTLEDYYK